MISKKINDILENYFADEAMIAEINEVLKSVREEELFNQESQALGYSTPENKDKLRLLSGGSGAVFMLDTKQVTQKEIRDWAILNGYAFVKCPSIDARLRVEKVAREIWGDTPDKYFID